MEVTQAVENIFTTGTRHRVVITVKLYLSNSTFCFVLSEPAYGGVKEMDFVFLLVAHSSQFTKRRRQLL
jgi:hypothetical protein